jgi:hypothetical protein
MNANTLQTGNFVIEAMEEKLLISVNGSSKSSTEISFEDLPTILEFLHTQRKLQMNRRKGFRLNFKDLKPEDRELFQLSVATYRGVFALEPIDFSLGGILAASELIVGNQGELVIITLAYDETSISLPAEVVRVSEAANQFAFHFRNVMGSDGKLDPPEELATIFAALEACWLDSSLDLLWN